MNRTRYTRTLPFALTLLASSSASAQVYLTTERAEPFVAIASIPGIGPVTNCAFVADGSFLPAADDGFAPNIPIGFTFNFLGTDFTAIGASSNGWITFGSAATTSFPSNTTVGNSAAPNNLIAPYWDDMDFTSCSFGVAGTAPNRRFVIQYSTFAFWNNIGTDAGQFQVWLFEGPERRFEIRYGGTLAFTNYAASMHYEGANGTPNGALRPCSTSCTATNFNSLSGRAVSVGLGINPELTGSVPASFPRGAFPGATAMGTVRVTNLGLNAATGVVTNIFLSADMTLDAADPQVGTFTTDAPNGDSDVPVTITVPANLATGDYFLIVSVDAANAFVEANEQDNVVVAAQRFATGYELQPTAVVVTNSGGVNSGDTINVNVTVTNNGVPRVGALEIELFASRDQLFDGMDAVIGTGTVNLTGTNIEVASVSGVLPQLAPGSYFVVARVDPNNLLAEANESNNIFVATTAFATGPDFRITSVTLPADVQPGAAANIVTTIGSIAVPYTGNVDYRLWASLDNTLDPMTDIALGSYTVALTGQASLADTQMVVFPATLMPARYYVIAVVDPNTRVLEVSEVNNTTPSTTTIINAVDFSVTNVTSSPTSVSVGANITVTGTARSLGLSYTGNLPVAVYLSADATFDPTDQPIYNGNVFIAGQTTAPITITTPARSFPGELPLEPRTYRVIVVVDPANTLPEALENNNSAASASTLTIQPVDLVAVDLQSDSTVFIGSPVTLRSTIENRGPGQARSFSYGLYLSDNNICRVTDQLIFSSATATLAPNQTQIFTDQVALPTFTATTTQFFCLIVEGGPLNPDPSPGNNIEPEGPISIVFPIPNLAAQLVETATAGAAGEQFAVTRILINNGVAPATNFEYAYYLSTNPTISPVDDILVGAFQKTLAEGEDEYGIDVLRLPSNLTEGGYYLGLVLDPDEATAEVDETDNVALTSAPVQIFRGTIQFVTDTLPRATVGVPYEVGLYATGGPLSLTYSVSDGALPAGLTLDGPSGILSGSPTTEGLYTFTVRASSGTAFAERPFSMRVVAPTVDLRVATPAVPTGIVGRAYSVSLIAVGGNVPYTWSAVNDAPAGLTLAADGTLSGTPLAAGNYLFTVRVRDELDGTASKELAVNIINASQGLQITQTLLIPGTVGRNYCEGMPRAFEARNGVAPYAWTAVGDLPPGMTLSAIGELCGTPTEAGRFPLLVRVQDQSGLFDTALFIFEVDAGTELAIATFELEDAPINQPYEATMQVIRGQEPYVWSVVEGWGALPAGITLSQDGVLSGTPTTEGAYAFVVQIQDGAKRLDVQPLSLRVVGITETPKTGDDDGCSCSTSETEAGTNTSLALMGGLVGLLGWRRRRLLGLAALAMGLGFATKAEAQLIPGTPYFKEIVDQTFTPLTSPTVLWTSVDDASMTVMLPFQVRFYENDFNAISVGSNGAIVMGAGTSISLSNATPGTTATPNNVVAPFWDDLLSSASGRISYLVEGSAPSRTVTVEWQNVGLYSGGGSINMQVRFHEGISGRIDFLYGMSTGTGGSGSMFIEDAMGARAIQLPAAACGTTCTYTTLTGLANKRVTLTQDPGVELAALGITGPELAFLGAETLVTVNVQSLHGAAIGPFSVAVLADTNPGFTMPIEIGSRQISLSPFQGQAITVTTVPPQSLGEGLAYLRLVVDSTNQIAEVNENNNIVVAMAPTRLVRGLADLAVASVTVSDRQVTAGGNITVFSRLRNVGGEVANNARFAVMLSANPVITRQDVELGTFRASLNPGQTFSATTAITIPAMTNSGTYYLGVFADADGTIDELSESNNGRATFLPVTIAGGNLAIVTTALPDAYVGNTYTALLAAVGGASNYQWRISAGRLPQGLGLTARGEIYGRPRAADAQTFTVEATSGMQTATRELSLAVVDAQAPLTIVSRSVPSGVVGQEYAFELVATGSRGSTVSWSATGLPPGLEFSAGGTLGGTPSEAGSFNLAVTAQAGAQMATRTLALDVGADNNLRIVPRVLPNAQFGQAYEQSLASTGGLAPINWIVVQGELPPGLEVGLNGQISGTPTRVGAFRFTVEARDTPTAGQAARDSDAFEIVVVDESDTFRIATDTLPVGYVGQGYDSAISATGGEQPYEWSIAEGRVPQGLLSTYNPTTGEFRIAGQPEISGVTNLLIAVTDRLGRTAYKAFVVRIDAQAPVAPTPIETDEGGCVCVNSTSSSGWMFLAFFGLFAFVRRR